MLRLLDVGVAGVLGLHQGVAHGAAAIQDGEAVGNGLNPLCRLPNFLLQVWKTKAELAPGVGRDDCLAGVIGSPATRPSSGHCSHGPPWPVSALGPSTKTVLGGEAVIRPESWEGAAPHSPRVTLEGPDSPRMTPAIFSTASSGMELKLLLA